MSLIVNFRNGVVSIRLTALSMLQESGMAAGIPASGSRDSDPEACRLPLLPGVTIELSVARRQLHSLHYFVLDQKTVNRIGCALALVFKEMIPPSGDGLRLSKVSNSL